MSWIEAIADKIYLSTDETDEETRKAYIEGKAKLADALLADALKDKDIE